MDKGIIEVLKKIKNDYGKSIFENKQRTTSLLSDYAGGQYKGEINLLNITLSLGILNEIKTTPSEYTNIRNRYIMRLKNEYFFTEEQAIFAVDVWGIIAGAINELERKVETESSQTHNNNSEYFSHSETKMEKKDGSNVKPSGNSSNSKVYINTNIVSIGNTDKELTIDEASGKLVIGKKHYKKGKFTLTNKRLKFQTRSGFLGNSKETNIQLNEIEKIEIINLFSALFKRCLGLMVVGLVLLIPSLGHLDSISTQVTWRFAFNAGFFLSLWSPIFMVCMSFIIPKKAIKIKGIYSDYFAVMYDAGKWGDEIKAACGKNIQHKM